MLPSSSLMTGDSCGMAAWIVREAGCRWLGQKKQRFVFTTTQNWFEILRDVVEQARDCILFPLKLGKNSLSTEQRTLATTRATIASPEI